MFNSDTITTFMNTGDKAAVTVAVNLQRILSETCQSISGAYDSFRDYHAALSQSGSMWHIVLIILGYVMLGVLVETCFRIWYNPGSKDSNRLDTLSGNLQMTEADYDTDDYEDDPDYNPQKDPEYLELCAKYDVLSSKHAALKIRADSLVAQLDAANKRLVEENTCHINNVKRIGTQVDELRTKLELYKVNNPQREALTKAQNENRDLRAANRDLRAANQDLQKKYNDEKSECHNRLTSFLTQVKLLLEMDTAPVNLDMAFDAINDRIGKLTERLTANNVNIYDSEYEMVVYYLSDLHEKLQETMTAKQLVAATTKIDLETVDGTKHSNKNVLAAGVIVTLVRKFITSHNTMLPVNYLQLDKHKLTSEFISYITSMQASDMDNLDTNFKYVADHIEFDDNGKCVAMYRDE